MITVDQGSEIEESDLTPEYGKILYYTGTPPKIERAETLSQTLLQHSQELKENMRNTAGLNQLMMQGLKPSGLESGRAIRAFHDLQSERHSQILKAFEQFTVQCADLLLLVLKDVKDQGGELTTVVTADGRDMQLSSAELNTDGVTRIVATPVSQLAGTVSGRLDDVEELIRIGIIDNRQDALQLLQFPDLNNTGVGLDTVQKLIMNRLSTDLLKDGKLVVPEDWWDIPLAISCAKRVLASAQLKGAPVDRQLALKVFIQKCVGMLPQPAPQPQQLTGGNVNS